MPSHTTPSMMFCPTCDKPFAKEQQYRRHISYCSKTHTVRKRQRSCRACGAAKVKCNFVVTGCTSCVKKGIECVYDFRKRPTSDKSATKNDQISENEEVMPMDANPPEYLSTPQRNSESESPNEMVLQPYSINTNNLMVLEMESPDFLSHDETFDFDFLNDNNFSYMSGKELQLGCRTPPPVFSPLSPMSSFLSLSSSSHFKRNTGQNSVQEVFLTMMIDMIQAYPRMMTNRTNLPPFIHHQFFASSPILHTCSALSHLFTVRTPSSRSFVWGSIWASIRELGKSAAEGSLQREDCVSATVATIVYLVMRAIDGDGEGEGSDWEMIAIYDGIKNRLMETTQHTPWIRAGEEETDPEPTWKDWIFLESIYRIGCTWFLLKLVFHIKTGGPCYVSDYYREIPLPCTKGEWEARTEEQWRSERAAAIIAKKDGLKTFGDLIDAQMIRGGNVNHEKLDVWIAGVDGLGMLLNLAVHLM